MQNWTSWGEIQKRIDVTSRWNWNRRRAFQALLAAGNQRTDLTSFGPSSEADEQDRRVLDDCRARKTVRAWERFAQKCTALY